MSTMRTWRFTLSTLVVLALVIGVLVGLVFGEQTAFLKDVGLVGFDIDMAHTLARELGVHLELVPVAPDQMIEQLNAGYCDIVMSGLAITPDRAQGGAFSAPYMELTGAFVVKDHRREEFSSRAALRRLKAPRIGAPNLPYYTDPVRGLLPQATIVTLTPAEFFEGRGEELAALMYSAEAGSAWSLLYPAYTVAIPQPGVRKIPVAYLLPRGDWEMVGFINTWLELEKHAKTIEALYDYWILGKNAVPRQPRWSVLRNVLHWVK